MLIYRSLVVGLLAGLLILYVTSGDGPPPRPVEPSAVVNASVSQVQAQRIHPGALIGLVNGLEYMDFAIRRRTGYLDALARLWFSGGKPEPLETHNGLLCTKQAEPIFNAHPNVARSPPIPTGPAGRRPAIVSKPVPA